jgi:16S rRNA (adenine1518-N6/adenine1519-N6)-dimethyltransferase
MPLRPGPTVLKGFAAVKGTPRGLCEGAPLLVHFRAVSPQKLGQHFLTDAAWRERIARAIRVDGGVWVEIGAGHGEMTALLAQRARKVIAVELDRRLAARLRDVVSGFGNVEIVEGDILALDLGQLAPGETFSVYGNLPYYITSPILHHLFDYAERVAAIHVVVQLEVARRIVAHPGCRDYGYFSVLAQWYSRPELALRIPPGAFRPRPKVSSALVSLRLPGARASVDVADEHEFLQFIKECFAQKRKMLRNNLRARLGAHTEQIIRDAGLKPEVRAEQLSIPQFAEVFRLLRGNESV